MTLQKKIAEKFSERFGSDTATETTSLFAAPGRINLIGEHTDYNDGFVMPGAIDKAIVAMIRPNGTTDEKSVVNIVALDLDDETTFEVTSVDSLPEKPWARYVYGVMREIMKAGGHIGGFDVVFAGDIPLGAGLSSSAALESCFATAINVLFNDGRFAPFELARIGQLTEHNYCGVKCGIMDQYASIHGRSGSLIKLDCRSLKHEYVDFNPDGYSLVLVDSRVKHELSGSPYNRRRESCERAASAMGVASLRDASKEMLESVKDVISDEDYRRATYVIGEIQRVNDVCEALPKGDFEHVGALMYQTHEGLSGLYEVSCDELDFLVDVARRKGVVGSRMMGGGFGGCTINLVAKEKEATFKNDVVAEFENRYGHKPQIYDVKICDGARKL